MPRETQSSGYDTIKGVLSILLVCMLSGCASRPINERIDQVDESEGYRPSLLMSKQQNNDPSTLFVLSFSGGGTRAASLSYGVLEELNRYQFVVEGQQRRLIDEIDVITGGFPCQDAKAAAATYRHRS